MAFTKVMVLVRGDESDGRAVSLAADMVRVTKGRLIVLYVIRVPRTLPVDADTPEEADRGEAALIEAEHTAHLPKESIESEIVQARETGPSVVHEAAVREVQALVIGTPYPSDYGAFQMPDDLLYVLEHAPCQVVLWRDSPRGAPVASALSHDRRGPVGAG